MSFIDSPKKGRQQQSISFSGWIATLCGLYLIGSGIFAIAKVMEGGSKVIDEDTGSTQPNVEMLRQVGIDSNAAHVAIVLSYVAGSPIFLGSGLLALGSIARSAKRNKA